MLCVERTLAAGVSMTTINTHAREGRRTPASASSSSTSSLALALALALSLSLSLSVVLYAVRFMLTLCAIMMTYDTEGRLDLRRSC